ncbi:MAG: lamin tail domain-containing protein [Verrucomicrobiales bacterium]
MRSHPQLMALAAVMWWAVPALSQEIHINEILAANNTISPDNVDFDDYSDWIELHNITASPVELSSYFLTDDLGQPLKWRIPAGALIAANGYFVVRADGFDAAPGQRYTREFAPWDSFQTRRYHTSFKLGSSEVGGRERASPKCCRPW